MMLCGEPGLRFRCRDYTCILNSRFNVVLYTEHTVLQDGALHALGFVVPTHYLSFVKTIDSRYGLQTSLLEMFEFERPQDAHALAEFVETQRRCTDYALIADLAVPKKKMPGSQSTRERPGRQRGRKKG